MWRSWPFLLLCSASASAITSLIDIGGEPITEAELLVFLQFMIKKFEIVLYEEEGHRAYQGLKVGERVVADGEAAGLSC